MIAVIGYCVAGIAGGVALCAGLLWWDFCAWRRERGAGLSVQHWLTDGDFPDCDQRTGEPLTEEDGCDV